MYFVLCVFTPGESIPKGQSAWLQMGPLPFGGERISDYEKWINYGPLTNVDSGPLHFGLELSFD